MLGRGFRRHLRTAVVQVIWKISSPKHRGGGVRETDGTAGVGDRRDCEP